MGDNDVGLVDLGEPCEVTDRGVEFVDESSGSQIAEKLCSQIQRLQASANST